MPTSRHYQIYVQGHLTSRFSDWFDLAVEQGFEQDQPVTILSGSLPDQSALHGVLEKIRALGLVLLEIKQLKSLG